MLQDLVGRAKRGDRDAFTALATITGDRLYAVAYRILRDSHRAEDSVQQVYLTAWRELPTLRDSDTAMPRPGSKRSSQPFSD